MDLSLVLGLLFAVATAIATNLAFLWKHRGAVAAPPVDLHHPVHSAAELFRSKWWAVGWAVAVVGWVAHVGALALAPLSLAQAVIAGGFVVLAVLAERMFGFGLGRRQWGGIALVAAGLAFLGATAPLDARETRYSLIAIAVFQAALLVFGLLLVAVTHRVAVAEHGPLEDDVSHAGDRPRTGGPPQAPVTVHATSRQPHRAAGILLGTAAGIAFAVSDVSIKALAQDVVSTPSAIISPWTLTALIASVGAFYASARSLQIGEGVSVITATTAAANLATIAGGIVVFGERLGDGTLESVLRLGAFALVVAGAVLMPGPTRAAEAGAEEERQEQDEREPRFTRAPAAQTPREQLARR
jgi:drug/metabolite transporter (DMT)-like permease